MREPFELTADEFTGPNFVADVFSIDGRDDECYEVLWEWAEEPANRRFPVWSHDGYSICEIEGYNPEGTFALLDPNGKPVGFYTSAQCWIDEEHRGKGLSTPLILAAADFHGGCPTENTQGLGFSYAGYAAHIAAHRAAVIEAFEKGKKVPEDNLRAYSLFEEAPKPR